MASVSQFPINGGLFPSTPHLLFSNRRRSASIFKLGLRTYQDASLGANNRTKGQAFRILANPNVSPGKRDSSIEVIMVNPSEAKQLAAKQMQAIQTKEKFKRRRQIEAINGAWAMIGLTAGLVIEGHTGKSFLAQLAGYWGAIVGPFVQ